MFRYAIALTGSIATGKSLATSIFKELGFVVIDADKIAHKLLDKHCIEIGDLFGLELITQKKVDRKALGEIVFQDKEKRIILESFLHPLIYTEIFTQSEKLDKIKKTYFVDIPLFFETNRYPIKKVLVVYTPKKTQLERLMKRDGYDKKEALIRMETQVDIEIKKNKATYLVNNSGNLDYLMQECYRVKELIMGDFK